MKNKKDKVFSSKEPKTKADHVGVELEIISKLDEEEMAELLAENDLENFVELKDDGSINTTDEYEYSHELCVLGNERNIYRIIKKLCSILRDNSTVNKSCGLHVHLDMRNRSFRKSYANLWSMQKLLYSICPPSRLGSSYCEPILSYSPASKSKAGYFERYAGINQASYTRHKTIEVRIHSGSLNATKINNWIKILIKTVNIDIKTTKDVKMFDRVSEVKTVLKLDKKLTSYLESRLNKFKDNIANEDLIIEYDLNTA